jgi:DNA-binding NarL/FixJ family response regulator
MPPTFTDEGIRAAALLRSQNPESPVLVLSHYVEERYAADLIASDTKGFGYLLKDRVLEVGDFLSAAERVARGGSALDPHVVATLLAGRGGGAMPHSISAMRSTGTGRRFSTASSASSVRALRLPISEPRQTRPPRPTASGPTSRIRSSSMLACYPAHRPWSRPSPPTRLRGGHDGPHAGM